MASVFRVTATIPLPDRMAERIEALRTSANAAEALSQHLPPGATVEATMVSPRGKRAAAGMPSED